MTQSKSANCHSFIQVNELIKPLLEQSSQLAVSFRSFTPVKKEMALVNA